MKKRGWKIIWHFTFLISLSLSLFPRFTFFSIWYCRGERERGFRRRFERSPSRSLLPRSPCTVKIESFVVGFSSKREKRGKMSFQDLEAGRGRQLASSSNINGGGGRQDTTQAVASGVFEINTAVSSFHRLVNTLGTPKDTPELRDKL